MCLTQDGRLEKRTSRHVCCAVAIGGYPKSDYLHHEQLSNGRMTTATEAFDVIILGAGAAGLMCALTTGQRGSKVLLLDHPDRVGAKILISGGDAAILPISIVRRIVFCPATLTSASQRRAGTHRCVLDIRLCQEINQCVSGAAI
jgi:hypothetical protein